MRGARWIRGGTAAGIACLVLAAVLWSIAHWPEDSAPATPAATTTTAPAPVPTLLGRCVESICLTPADPGIQAALDYDAWKLEPAELDILDLTVHGAWAALVASSAERTILGVVDLHSGQWMHMDDVPLASRPLWVHGTLHYVSEDGAASWDGTLSRSTHTGRPVAAHGEQVVWTCDRTLCDRNETGTWQRSQWPGHALSIGLESRIVRLEDGLVLAEGAFWDGLAGDGPLAAWLEVGAGGNVLRTWTSAGIGTMEARSDVAPAVVGPWIVYAHGPNVLMHRPDLDQTIVAATLPSDFEAYPMAAGDEVAFALHPVSHGSPHYLVTSALPRDSG